jgi:uncharacterized membrane protein YphA (DoxX/SURF4 family)
MKPPQTALPAPGPSDWIALAARVAVGLVLIAAGALKASSAPEEFSYIIEQYQLVGSDVALVIATFMPWVELIVGYALVLGWFTRPASGLAALMFASFTFALASTKLRGIELPNCGCFGSSWHMPPSATMILDLLLLFCCLAAFARGRERLSLDNWAERGYTGRK